MSISQSHRGIETTPLWWIVLMVVLGLHAVIIVGLMGLSSPRLEMRADGHEDRVEGTAVGKMVVFKVEDLAPLMKPAVESSPEPELMTKASSKAADLKATPPAPKKPKPERIAKSKPKPKPIAEPLPAPTPVPEQVATQALPSPKVAESLGAESTVVKAGSHAGEGTSPTGVEGASGQTGSGRDAYTSANHEGGALHNPKPRYPAQSIELGEQGRVYLRVHVQADGRPSQVEVLQSSGYRRLDRAAKRTVEEAYRFIPATRYGVPVASVYEFGITFKLD